MTTIYSDKDFLAVYKQRKKVLTVFFAVTAVYAAICLALWIYYMSLPYKSPLGALPKTLVFCITPIYIVFLFPFMGIKYRRVSKYYKALLSFSTGLKTAERNYFYGFEEHSMQKDNIDVVYCIFESWHKKKQEWYDRAVYFDPEKAFPAIESGECVEYVLQSNFLLQYRVLDEEKKTFNKYVDAAGDMLVVLSDEK